jgi:hypothetical protein
MRELRGPLFYGLNNIVEPQRMAMSKDTVIPTVDKDMVCEKEVNGLRRAATWH